MSLRTERHALLLRLVDERAVQSQADLLDALAGAGQEVHQSTLSRDLRELGIRKVRGRYRVGATPPAVDTASPEADREVAPNGATLPVVHGFTACGPNLITVRTATGQAQLLGVLLDSSKEPAVAGTIAGDDTVLVVTRGRPEQRAAEALLTAWFGEGAHVGV